MRTILYSVAFVSGTVVMTLELVGSRILAPYVGASVFVWTSLIGLIMASLCVGYIRGGKMADRDPSIERLARIIFFAGIGIAWTLYSEWILSYGIFNAIDIRIGSIVLCAILFAPATIYLGMISPFLVKLRVNDLATSGASAGALNSLGAAGSIAGTFLGGYFLVSYFRTETIIFSLSVVMCALALVVTTSSRKRKIVAAFLLVHCIVFFFIQSQSVLAKIYPRLIADINSPYSRYWVYDYPAADGRTRRYITNNYKVIQSGIFLDTGETSVEYIDHFNLFEELVPNANTTLMIGAGAYTYPKMFADKYPEKRMDVVEIDPSLVKISKDYFGYKEYAHISHIHEDGRMFLEHSKNTYDAIFIDAFSSYASIPVQLTTKEAVTKVYERLDEKGVVIANIIGSLKGEKALFLESAYATYKSVFPAVYLLPVIGTSTDAIQNVMLIAFKTAPAKSPAILNAYEPDSDFRGTVLLDSFAPVEKFTASLLY